MRTINEQCVRQLNGELDESFIQDIMRFGRCEIDRKYYDIAKAENEAFCERVYNSIREYGYNLSTTPIVFVGGGASVMKLFGGLSQSNITYILDVKANAKGYEQLAMMALRKMKKLAYAAAVDVLVDVGVLMKAKAEEWRFGKIPYLEAACSCNLRQLNLILKEMRVYSEKSGYKPSFCYYKRWGTKKKNGQGKKPVIPLRFSKSGNELLEKTYATHYVKKEFFSKKEECTFCEEKENFTD